ncbi:MAG: glutathione reductase (NADPH) [Hyphomicrobiaceae bacterium]|jgi:glutathione reductase (NADPH)
MADKDYDLVVLGAGSGGLATAKRAASYGMRVAILENDRVGGTCVIRGCIPKKLMVYAADLGRSLADAEGYGWLVDNRGHRFAEFVRTRNEAVLNLERTHERLLKEAGVELLRGSPRVVAPDAIEVDGRRISCTRILVATGARPQVPKVDGIEHAMTSDGFFERTTLPERVAIVGGGYIAVELAGICEGLGSEVHLIIRKDLPLRGFDGDIRVALLEGLRGSGIQVHTETSVRGIQKQGDGITLNLTGGNGDWQLDVDDALLYATGRIPNTETLGLAEVGVELGRDGSVVCDEDGNTKVETILAVGDVTGRAMLTPVAIQAGRAIADRVWGGLDTHMDYTTIPTAVFSDPPIGTVGLTEEEAREQYGDDDVRVYKSSFNPLLHMLSGRRQPTTMKMIVRIKDDRVLGCHLVGHDAGEIIQGFAVAVKMGATKADFDATVGIHPSTAEEFVTMR